MLFQPPLWERRLPRIAACLVGTIACISLAGWILRIPVLTSIFPGVVSMKANTAIAFLLLSGAVCAATQDRWPGWQRLLAVAAAALGLLTLIEYASGTSFGIDQILFRDPGSAPIPDEWPPSAPSVFYCLPLHC